ncbi:hypothetical protein YC2023_098876 [Brassica napus]
MHRMREIQVRIRKAEISTSIIYVGHALEHLQPTSIFRKEENFPRSAKILLK